MKILVTGACGFIGSNFIQFILEEYPNHSLINVDYQTYAGKGNNLEYMGINNNKNYKFYHGDICDDKFIDSVFSNERPEVVVNFAAESHVDRSIENSYPFVKTNIQGTLVLLEASKKYEIKKFVQIGTDEVYGSLGTDSQASKENDPLKPRSPYSASKASADLLALSYFSTFSLPVVVTRCSNNYGPFQFPEKAIPLFVTNLLEGKKIPLYGNGKNVRDWIHVKDHCAAILAVIEKGKVGNIYNIGGNNQTTNIELTHKILKLLNKDESSINYVEDRKGHDMRYDIDCSKIESELGWNKKIDFDKGLKDTVDWYVKNEKWWKKLK